MTESGLKKRVTWDPEDLGVDKRTRKGKAGKAAEGNVHIYHGSPGDPGYPALHPKHHEGKTKTPGGGVLGSHQYTEAEHKAAADEYLFEAYAMNEWLRHHKLAEGTANDPGDLEDFNSKLMDLIQVQEPSTKDQVVYRGVGGRFNINAKGNAGQMKPGTIFDDKGFISTSGRLEVAEKFAGLGGHESYDQYIMEITIPKGTRYLDTDKTLRDKPAWEQERILMPGTKFRFTGYVPGRFDQGKPPILKVEVVPA